jgi:hypothetical protein
LLGATQIKKRVMYSYSQVEKYMGKAYGMRDVSALLNKHTVTLHDYILEGKIKAPQKIYPIGDPDNKNWSKYMFNEKGHIRITRVYIRFRTLWKCSFKNRVARASQTQHYIVY